MVLRARTGLAEVLRAGGERGLVECIDLFAAVRDEREMHRRDRVKLLGRLIGRRSARDPELRLAALSVSAELAGELAHDADGKRRERLIVERLRARVIG